MNDKHIRIWHMMDGAHGKATLHVTQPKKTRILNDLPKSFATLRSHLIMLNGFDRSLFQTGHPILCAQFQHRPLLRFTERIESK